MLELRNLSKIFHTSAGGTVRAIDGISITLPKGCFCVLAGNNGSGKSTLLNLIAGEIKPDAGDILMNGKSVNDLASYARSGMVSRVFQNPSQGSSGDLTIIENFRIAARRGRVKTLTDSGTARFRHTVSEMLARLNMGLENRLNEQVRNLSGGQRQAVSLLMSVIAPSEIILLDEPTAALDPGASELITRLASEVIRENNLTAIIVTHNPRHFVSLGERLIYLKQGKVFRDLNQIEKLTVSPEEIMSWF